jgi:uncharacterized protein involved in outer membrane biogenesis
MRWLMAVVLALAALLGAGWLLLGRYDFGPLLAARASVALGRSVSIGSLHLAPGRWVKVSLHNVRLDNVSADSQQPMVQLESLAAEVDLLSILRGPLLIRQMTAEGVQVFLERTTDGIGNWQFGPRQQVSALSTQEQASRSGFPTLLDLRFAGSELTYRTSSGALLRIRLDALALGTPADDAPVRLTITGAYNGTPVSIDADMASIVALRDASRPYEAEIRIASGDTSLHFRGTLTDPLNVEGAKGVLTLAAQTPAAILAIAGTTSTLDTTLHLTGQFEHAGDLWQLTDATGRVDAMPFTAPLLRLVEGTRGKPDAVTAEMAFERLDLNALLGEGRRGSRSNADLSLAVDRAPDTLAAVQLTAGKLLYSNIEANNVRLEAELDSGLIAMKALHLAYMGGRIEASGQIAAIGEQGRGRINARVDVIGMEVQALRRMLGIGDLPLLGRMNAQFAVLAEGATLNAATREARASAVVDMLGGSISRRLVEIASIDVRSLFRAAQGMSPISCLVAVLDIRAGAGTISPLRIRSQNGTIVGSGSFNLLRRQVDLTVGSESATTSAFALDVPVRVSGPLASPTVRPARWSAAGRAQLAASDNVNRLLPELRPFARRNPCIASR